jgi:2-keto-4-pentenoate hydratase/2-oxohepta-3-ene-1,7-dioic acid hydratase in catechol pathway
MALYVRFQRPDGTAGAGLLEGDTVAAIREPFWSATERTGESLPLRSVRLLPPSEPRNIVCVGLNYSSHLQGRPIPDPPTLFFKPLSSIAGHGDDVVLPPDAGRVDPEGEIVIVVGRTLHRASRDEALAGVFGYTAGNDVSARAWQRADGQWWRAKGSDTFGVFGPAIVTGLAHDAIRLETRVNGIRAQYASSDELIRDIPEILRLVSAVMTLLPGDIVYTGTPGEPQPLNPGDIMEVEITGCPPLRNRVVAG